MLIRSIISIWDGIDRAGEAVPADREHTLDFFGL